jgi:hypothetical protein
MAEGEFVLEVITWLNVTKMLCVRKSQRCRLSSCYKHGFMLWLMLALFTWLRSFVRSRHDLGLEIVALEAPVDCLEAPNQASAKNLLSTVQKRQLGVYLFGSGNQNGNPGQNN